MKELKLIKIRNIIIMGVLLMITSIALIGCEADHNDGKCDICGKKAIYTGKEEYCDKHAKDAAEWYMKQAVDYDNK